MASPAIEEALSRAETSVEAGDGLSGTGFWSAVATVKRDRELADRYGRRIAAADAAAARQWAMLVVPLGVGTALMLLATAVGGALLWWSGTFDELVTVVVFFAGMMILLVTTHGLGHLVVGRLLGIRFLYWFLGPPSFPLKGGVKIDYASYLKAPARSRAWMHAAGAVATKLVPFALIGPALAVGLPAWAVWVIVLVGVGAILTDVLWSTTKSDWKRFRREMAFAQD